jgi:hypothetical protein
MILETIEHYLETHCLIFFHDWQDTNEFPNLTPNSENWYWIVQRCNKCKGRRLVMKDYS